MSRPDRRRMLSALLSAAVLLGAVALLRRDGELSSSDVPSREPPLRRDAEAPPVQIGSETRWMGVAGGAEPESTQVSIEQDLTLAMEILGDEGLVLFAGGAGVPAVQETRDGAALDPLRLELGEFFDPRGGRRSRYRAPRPEVHGAASADNALDGLEELLELGDEPFLFFVTGHGEPGETPADNLIRLWGAWPLAVRDLAEVLDASSGAREVRVVMATCFSGGFAEIAFLDADPEAGRALTPRCGLFASPWDDESSGCVPDPDRSRQDGYAMHFLNALGGRDADGNPLSRGRLDLDGDGAISLLEAHSRARIASRSIDIPTTTSERWLRYVSPDAAESDDVAPSAEPPMPEEDAVATSLGALLSLSDETTAREALLGLDDSMERVAAISDEFSEALDQSFFALRISLLERWPTLEDPWHPDFEPTLSRDHASIAAHLSGSEAALEYRGIFEEVDRLASRYERLRERRALTLRLLRAFETRRMASALAGKGGEAYGHYLRLLECERGRP